MTLVLTADEAVADAADGSTVLVGGFGTSGMPFTPADSHVVDDLSRTGGIELVPQGNLAERTPITGQRPERVRAP